VATKLKGEVAREVSDSNGQPLIVTMTGQGLLIRRKGSRTTYGPVSYSQLEIYMARLEADSARAERKSKPRVKRGLIL